MTPAPGTAVVVGAGIAGLATAQRLAHHRWRVHVLEQAPGPRPQGYMIDFFGPGHEAAQAMGLLPRIRELGRAFARADLVGADGTTRASLRFDRFARSLGGSVVSLMRPDLERALRESLPQNVQVRYGCGPRAITEEPDGVRVHLPDGHTLHADLLVGADGIHSTVRRLLFGPQDRYLHPLGFHTGAYTFTDARIHALTRDRFCLTDTLGAQMGLYALGEDRVAAFTVHRTDHTDLPADPRDQLQRTYAGLGWVVPRALQLCPPPEHIYYDLVAQVRMGSWSRGRTVLVGDACQAVSLLAGQGASLAVGGAYVLGEELARADTVAQALQHYEDRWRPVVAERQRAARTGTGWFLPTTPGRLRLRRLALRLSALPGVDRLVATSVSGRPTRAIQDLAPDLPS
ncbi:FAD-dependent monooxygenase [Nocardiopsis sp. HNM0947]|uniref:FAD-dependent monooxygenase n=1 Tax=Nocardiopsis coralli TaxID=2772213 RepID=A0ABR9P6W4_9ACTN|nr:FAD-dependent monooxygenase [Nocardiopsis coralli]MBE2999571.1 FAD-dependent monooxygenase [Nocardiopsis coralli]